uniref:Uncharacterized protein n=1 Tax=Anguilla anguilla TaxID=7936 RepID=A0A0E9TG40_ANGAN
MNIIEKEMQYMLIYYFLVCDSNILLCPPWDKPLGHYDLSGHLAKTQPCSWPI